MKGARPSDVMKRAMFFTMKSIVSLGHATNTTPKRCGQKADTLRTRRGKLLPGGFQINPMEVPMLIKLVQVSIPTRRRQAMLQAPSPPVSPDNQYVDEHQARPQQANLVNDQ